MFVYILYMAYFQYGCEMALELVSKEHKMAL